jgi:RHS repeat-associated protein
MLAIVVVLWTNRAHAGPSAGDSTDKAEKAQAPADYTKPSLEVLSRHLQTTQTNAAPGSSKTDDGTENEAPPALSQVARTQADGDSGGDSSAGGGGGQSVALPGSSGTTLGMGESFSPELSTGVATFSIPLLLPTARGGAQPQLRLSYSSAGGFDVAGKGWAIGAPAISRQTDRGFPSYIDGTDYQPRQDRFAFGGLELVPICTVHGGACSGLPAGVTVPAGEVLPGWAEGWQYFRARVESTFVRVFWSPDHRTWRTQSKDGTNMEFGVPLDGSGYADALQTNPDEPQEIFRWYLVRQYDSEGGVNATAAPRPVNVVVYRYVSNAGTPYLSDIYDTPPADPSVTGLAVYAHHTHFNYEARPDIVDSYRAGWKIDLALRVTGIDVTSKPFSGAATSSRVVVRRYRLTYDPSSHVSLLTSVQMEGRCTTAATESASELLPDTSCPTLPAIQFEYQHVASTGDALLDSQGLAFEAIAEKVQALANSPTRSLDDPLTNIMDVNGDGLPDVVVSAPALFNGGMGVYFNGLTSTNEVGFGNAKSLQVQSAGTVDAEALRFNNPVVSALDMDGDGLVDLVHMPRAKVYTIFSLAFNNGWSWVGRSVSTATAQDAKINFTSDARNVRVMDVNGDGLVDVVYSSPTEYQTFFSLGRYPGGGDQFGNATRTTTTTADISNDPVTACAPWSATPARFSDPDVMVADMNGDGLPDIVRLRSGQILYWPGRGNGFWGTGARNDCAGGNFAVDRHIEMLSPPQFGVFDPGSLMLSDVNGDGLADLVEVRNQDADVYLNDNGVGWTQRHTIAHTPSRLSSSRYVRITDVDGSGSPDILWGEGRAYKYIDLTGGIVPHLLSKVSNGFGSTNELQYKSSPQLMREASLAGSPWTEPLAPTVTPVLVRSTVRDHLELVGRPAGVYVNEYTYRDPVYEGRQRAFAGFRQATVRTLGDSNSPTSSRRTTFELGECPKESIGTASDVCSPSTLWQDNWSGALKGLPTLSEVFDEYGVYASTEHSKYELRQLYTGLDGRRVVVPFPVEKDGFLYDTPQFDGAPSSVVLDRIAFNLTGIQSTKQDTVIRRATARTAHVSSRTFYDNFGNVTDVLHYGCMDGCPGGAADEVIQAHSDFSLPPGDTSGWLWRESHAYISGSQHGELRSERRNTFTAQGKLKQQDAILSGTVPLDRFHATGLTIAPAPANASGGVAAPATVTLVQNTLDGFGRITSKLEAGGRFISTDYDPVYAQLAIASHSFVGLVGSNGHGSTELIRRDQYDRGLAAITDSTDETGQPSHFDYDGLGRLVETTFADPARPGQLATAPTQAFFYVNSSDPTQIPYSTITTTTARGADAATSSAQILYEVVSSTTDGLGRPLITTKRSNPNEGDGASGQSWTVSGITIYNAKGEEYRTYEPYFGNSDQNQVPPAGLASTSVMHDAFGQVVDSTRIDGSPGNFLVHHALSQDIWDPADRTLAGRAGTFTTIVSDGHGRGIERTVRLHVAGGAMEQRNTLNEYLPTGEVVKVTEQTTGYPDIVRWLKYDTLGRMVLNVEPNTSTNFTSDPNAPISTFKAFRYAYDDAGDLVGFSDARGCGSNYFYDAGGRQVAEDRSPCLASQPLYTAPNLTTGDGTEAFYRYDTPDPQSANVVDDAGVGLVVDASVLPGRLASVSGLGSKAVFRYDALGRTTGVGTRIAVPGTPTAALASRYTPRWYVKLQTVDALDRVTSETTGVTVPALMGSDGKSHVDRAYSMRGGLLGVWGSYGTLVGGTSAATHAIQYDADGLTRVVRLGDAASTERDYDYNARRRINNVMTFRATAPLWSSPPAGGSYIPPAMGAAPTQQLLLEDYQYGYDEVDNITDIQDFRTDAEWPSSAKPMKRHFDYDDLYRLINTTSVRQSGGGPDTWNSPYDAENKSSTRTPQPTPHVAFINRPTGQTYAYDRLGNFTQTTDDQSAFWDRSLGAVSMGTPANGPDQIRSASNRSLAPSSANKGDLSVSYDSAGNVARLIVRRDSTSCLPAGASCWQRFDYDWDEVGELSHARRWDLSSAERSTFADTTSSPPTRPADADLTYAYDAAGGRTLKTAVNRAGTQRNTLYIFPTLEVRSTAFANGEYGVDATTEQVRLHAGPAVARVVNLSTPLESTNSQHVFLEFADQVGSTNVVVDQASGELVEAIARTPYGAADSDYRPDRFANYREPYGFGGKEEDIELGLSYFGARYYSPYLGVWMSVDPADIHGLSSETNPYAYVHGTPVMMTDPDGRILPLIIGWAIFSAVVGMGTNAAVQMSHNQPFDVLQCLGAGAVSGVAGAASVGVAGLASAALPGVFTAMGISPGVSTLLGGIGANALASATGFTTQSLLTGHLPSPDGFGKALAEGGASGLAMGALHVAFPNLPMTRETTFALGYSGSLVAEGVRSAFGDPVSIVDMTVDLGGSLGAAWIPEPPRPSVPKFGVRPEPPAPDPEVKQVLARPRTSPAAPRAPPAVEPVDPPAAMGCDGACVHPTSHALDWSIVSKNGETREQHVALHEGNYLQKELHGVFYGDAVSTINNAWTLARENRVLPTIDGGVDIYTVPFPNAGWAGGYAGQGQNLNSVTIITVTGTNRIITGFPR